MLSSERSPSLRPATPSSSPELAPYLSGPEMGDKAAVQGIIDIGIALPVADAHVHAIVRVPHSADCPPVAVRYLAMHPGVTSQELCKSA